MPTGISLARARELVALAESAAQGARIAIATTIVDSGGNTVLFARMDGTQLASSRISTGKAYTAVAWERASGELWAIAQPGEGGYGIDSIDHRFVLSAGGLPIWDGGSLVGAIGVSGGTAEQDEFCAASAIASVDARETSGVTSARLNNRTEN